jgi:hypothetical protein
MDSLVMALASVVALDGAGVTHTGAATAAAAAKSIPSTFLSFT